jgi:hypothetical protein
MNDVGEDAWVKLSETQTYKYGRAILGARIKNTKLVVQEKILSKRPAHGQCLEIFINQKDKKVRLIYSYSDKRAYRDQQNREKGLRKLEKSLEGDLTIAIDYNKYAQDGKWDGLKGYITNTNLNKEEVIEQYG